MQPHSVTLLDRFSGRWLSFSRPQAVLQARTAADVLPALEKAAHLVETRSLWAAGLVAYEASPAFDQAMRIRTPGPMPLLWLGLFPQPAETGPPPPTDAVEIAWQPDVDEGAYLQAIQRIKAHIARGDTYQVNYTLRLRAPFSGDPWRLFGALVKGQGSGYPAFVHTGRFAVCSASPELFFDLDGNLLRSRPMKGTAPRGRSSLEDDENARRLQASEKNRAENVMIVDMVRNDMGRIAEIGSVRVPALFEIERYPTLLQMTSTVESTTRARLPQVFQALFPCASITGAPKIRTMEIIESLESSPRGVYTGAIGFWAPGRRAQFNVAIRTAVIDLDRRMAEYGTGSGIVWDSDGGAEYAECLLKTRVLTSRREEFSLLETLLWSPREGYFLLDRHLERMAASAAYYGFVFDSEIVGKALAQACAGRQVHLRVRLLLEPGGRAEAGVHELQDSVESFARLMEPHDTDAAPWELSPTQVDPADAGLYHKTTRRGIYEAAEAARPGFKHVLLWNGAGEATEFTRANLVALIRGRRYTPPLSCGLLPGTLRAELLARDAISEHVLTLEDIRTADAVWALNSLRGWQPVRPAGTPGG